MARQLFEYDPPDRFVAGTVGEPGGRTFYLQATGGGRTTSVALEKSQVSVLAERVEQLLEEVARRGSATEPAAPFSGLPGLAPLEDNAPLDVPVVEDFRVGTMALAWDNEDLRVVIEAQAQAPDGDDATEHLLGDDDDGPDLLRVRVTAPIARAFAKRALAVVAAGRPPCPFCDLPLDPAGHVCPRMNGYRR